MVPSLIHEPWKINEMEQTFYNCRIGFDYPFPIVDIEESRKYASNYMCEIKKSYFSKQNGLKILMKLFRLNQIQINVSFCNFNFDKG
ncbi:MAG: FAD-binding domain-containing protein [Bacteroidota bacterium]